MIHKADMTLESDVQDCFEYIKSAMGRIDYLIYSAGFAPDADIPLAAYSTAAWLKTLNTYVTGFFLCFRESLQVMEKTGHIVAVSSAVTRFRANALPPIYAGHYAAAKAALDELCKWGKREAAERGILLSRIAPGAVDSPVHRTAPVHLRPSAMVPVSVVSEKIIAALLSGEEIDEVVVAA
jgi:NAD(P)-dependent dehydrogenase (short-subunit alcohol dehydrogenase family)